MCTITLEDVALQLGLPMDGPIIMGLAVIQGKVDLCMAMLGKVPNRFEDFSEYAKLSWGSTVLSTLCRELSRAMQSDKMLIGGCLLLLQSWAWWRIPFLCHKVIDLYMFPLVTRWNHRPSYVRLPNELDEIRLLLDQCSKTV
ncbi:hypothetical protein CXB51_017479 [Gossypium anomalum]|uniref:Aminotransferase-like plant mobile domain-containing protein n=1 Tax=Gossypium anomalum TaxID=47600 RepID=A0A8J5Z691_9ROSI|nr:hypothetical protein CXB51_017479 [Gossypium anomalum]